MDQCLVLEPLGDWFEKIWHGCCYYEIMKTYDMVCYCETMQKYNMVVTKKLLKTYDMGCYYETMKKYDMVSLWNF